MNKLSYFTLSNDTIVNHKFWQNEKMHVINYRTPIRFTFEFYKPKDSWVVYSFKYDDAFDDDVENIINRQLIKTGN